MMGGFCFMAMEGSESPGRSIASNGIKVEMGWDVGSDGKVIVQKHYDQSLADLQPFPYRRRR